MVQLQKIYNFMTIKLRSFYSASRKKKLNP